MARGLSDLQKKILKIAYRNRGRGKDIQRASETDISNREVLIEVYNFSPIRSLLDARNGAISFDRRAIGMNRYRAASVSVAKVFNRLVERGLAIRKYGGGQDG